MPVSGPTPQAEVPHAAREFFEKYNGPIDNSPWQAEFPIGDDILRAYIALSADGNLLHQRRDAVEGGRAPIIPGRLIEVLLPWLVAPYLNEMLQRFSVVEADNSNEFLGVVKAGQKLKARCRASDIEGRGKRALLRFEIEVASAQTGSIVMKSRLGFIITPL